MSKNEIPKRARKIKELIADSRMDAAFEQLEAFIADIDGLDEEKAEELGLQNRLFGIRNRLKLAEKKLEANPDGDQVEYNSALQGLLSLVDDVQKVALDDPNFAAKPETTAQVSDNQEVITAYMPIEKAKNLNSDGSENKGCMFAFIL